MSKKFNYIVKLITGINGRGTYLEREDVYTLLFLYEQRTAAQIQLKAFYELLKKREINRVTFLSKMKKWDQLKLIKRSNVSLKKRDGALIDFVSIHKRGVELLYEIGLVPSPEMKEISLLKRQYEHNLAIRQFVLNVIKLVSNRPSEHNRVMIGGESNYLYVFDDSVREQLGLKNLMYCSNPDMKSVVVEGSNKGLMGGSNRTEHTGPILFPPALPNVLYSYNPISLRNSKEEQESNVIPDWLFSFNHCLMHVEIDTGTEQHMRLEEKIRKYIVLANQQTEQHHTVLIALIDNSYTTINDYKSRAIRVGNIKRALGERDALRITDNLSVYVFPMGRTQHIVSRLLAENFLDVSAPLSTGKKFLGIAERLNQHQSFPFIVEWITDLPQIRERGIVHQKLLEEINGIYVFREKNPKKSINLLEFLVIPLMLKEGDVLSHSRMIQLSNILYEFDSQKGRQIVPEHTKILGIYSAVEGMESGNSISNDVFHNVMKTKYVWLTSEAELFNCPATLYSTEERVGRSIEEFFNE